jgi:importin-9
MGLKILIDKWLLQQSLFRGKYAKISTYIFVPKFRFMALSKLFLLGDKRVDNLLVIGFNPSHTNISNDVTAPLKILATLIRCLDNEKGF